MVQMSPKQLAFYRALFAPFHDSQLSLVPGRGSKGDLTYLDKRALSNRLDTVCGPFGWYPEYEATSRGYKCRLYILVPTSESVWTWIHKDDGAGFEEMGSTNRQTGQFEADVDNDEKSGYTNAFRRAAQDAWGIGRYLYKKGVPAWFDPNAKPEDALVPADIAAQNVSGSRQARSDYDDSPSKEVAAPDPVAASAPVASTPAQVSQQHAEAHEAMSDHGAEALAAKAARDAVLTPDPVERLDLPPAGRDVFAWMKNLENKFRTQLQNGMRNGAINRNLNPNQMYVWPQEAVNEICVEAVTYIKTLPTYGRRVRAYSVEPHAAGSSHFCVACPDRDCAAEHRRPAVAVEAGDDGQAVNPDRGRPGRSLRLSSFSPRSARSVPSARTLTATWARSPSRSRA